MQYSYLALGDSYTIGEKVDPQFSFPAQLRMAMQANKVELSPPTIVAKTGWTCEELIQGITQTELEHQTFDLVTLLVGVNDQYRGCSVEEYGPKFQSLLKIALALVGERPKHLMVLSVPDYSCTPFGLGRNPTKIAEQIKAFNRLNRKLTDKFDATYIDITKISRMGLSDSSLLVNDLLHPSAKMYALWVKEMLAPVMKLFSISNGIGMLDQT